MDVSKLEEWLEVEWLAAKDRGDHRGQVLALLGLVEVKMVQCQLEASHGLHRLSDLFPLKADGSLQHPLQHEIDGILEKAQR